MSFIYLQKAEQDLICAQNIEGDKSIYHQIFKVTEFIVASKDRHSTCKNYFTARSQFFLEISRNDASDLRYQDPFLILIHNLF